MSNDKGKGRQVDGQAAAAAASSAAKARPPPQSEFESAYQEIALGGKDRERKRTAERNAEREMIIAKAGQWPEHVSFIEKELKLPTYEAQLAIAKHDGDLHKALMALTAP